MIKELYNFQKYYLIKVLDNIDDREMFKNIPNEINSPAWILAHLIVEIQDVFNYLETEIKPLPNDWFSDFTKKKLNINNLPSKEVLIKIFEYRYDFLMKTYQQLTEEEKLANHPSKMLSKAYTNVDAWIAHHLITHLAVHIGNITTWKKINNITVNGI